jgi:hypothetical protein
MVTNCQKSASIWLKYIEGWQARNSGHGTCLNMPMATDDIRKRLVKLYNDEGKKAAGAIAFNLGYTGFEFDND